MRLIEAPIRGLCDVIFLEQLMSYKRVLPRDLFNEGNLLKCYGRLWILTEGYSNVEFEFPHTGPFEIEQDPSDGSLSVTNVTFRIKDKNYPLSRPLNDREEYPLEIFVGDEGFPVFINKGLSRAVLALLNS